jgi:carboxymethylenebutenolidase
VTDIQRYIAEEIAIDHIDGLMSRREALRRLALLGLSAGAASALIAACGSGGQKQAAPSTTPSTSGPTTATPAVTSAPPGMDRSLPTAPVTWAGPNGELQGAWAQAADVRGGVLVIHENRGLNDWVRSVAGRFAGVGYSALAIDLLSEEGGTGKFTDPAEATAALSKVPPDRFVSDMKSGVEELQRRVGEKKVAAVGFCFGGGMVWRLLGSGEPQLAVAVPFYGPLPDSPDFAGSKAAVLAIYAALDNRVTSTKDAAVAALNRAGLVNEVIVEPNADHAFFNDTGQRYNAAAAADAWRKVLDWFGRYVG